MLRPFSLVDAPVSRSGFLWRLNDQPTQQSRPSRYLCPLQLLATAVRLPTINDPPISGPFLFEKRLEPEEDPNAPLALTHSIANTDRVLS